MPLRIAPWCFPPASPANLLTPPANLLIAARANP